MYVCVSLSLECLNKMALIALQTFSNIINVNSHQAQCTCKFTTSTIILIWIHFRTACWIFHILSSRHLCFASECDCIRRHQAYIRLLRFYGLPHSLVEKREFCLQFHTYSWGVEWKASFYFGGRLFFFWVAKLISISVKTISSVATCTWETNKLWSVLLRNVGTLFHKTKVLVGTN